MLIAIPSDVPGGLDAEISEQFENCTAFTLVSVEENLSQTVEILEIRNDDQRDVLALVSRLKEHGIEVLIADRISRQSLLGFRELGVITFFKESAGTVKEAIELFVKSRCGMLGAEQRPGKDDQEEGEHETNEASIDVQAGRIITLDYEIRSSTGKIIDTSLKSGPMRYLHGSGMIMPNVEKALDGRQEGAYAVVEVTAADAYGLRDESRILSVPRSQLPFDTSIGAIVSAHDQKGRQISLTVVELNDEIARLDGNHKLAGLDLSFEITVTKIEIPTAEELEQLMQTKPGEHPYSI